MSHKRFSAKTCRSAVRSRLFASSVC